MPTSSNSLYSRVFEPALMRYRRLAVPARAAIWLTFCSLLQKGISVLTTPLFTRLLTTEEYGQVSVFNSWANLLIIFTSLSLSSGVFNTIMIRRDGDHARAVSALYGLVITITCCLTAIVCGLFYQRFTAWIGLSGLLLAVLILKLLCAPAYNLWMAQKRYEYHYRQFVLFTIALSIVNPIISYIAVVHSSQRGTARIVSSTLAECAFYLVIAVLLFARGRCFYDGKIWRTACKVNVPLVPHFLSGTILNQADRIMIQQIIGLSAAGIYSVSYSAAMLLHIVTMSLDASFTPWLYKKLQKGEAKAARPIALMMFLGMCGLSLLFSLLAPECMKLLASPEYYVGISLFPILIAGEAFNYLTTFFTNVELYHGKSAFIAGGSCLSAVLNILLNALWIGRFGYLAAAYSTFLCYALNALLQYGCMRWVLRREKAVLPYPMTAMFGSAFLLSACLFLIQFLYPFLAIRYAVILVLLAVFFFLRRPVFRVLRQLRSKD